MVDLNGVRFHAKVRRFEIGKEMKEKSIFSFFAFGCEKSPRKSLEVTEEPQRRLLPTLTVLI